jgi:ubiquinone/menaquinone biosynthesis C-methylase UbiE
MKLNIGSGFTRIEGFTNIDHVAHVDDEGNQYTDILCDIEKEPLPFEDNSIDEIACYETLEHLENLIFAMNEMWRVLKPEGFLKGKVPKEGSKRAIADPTHKRIFLADTFDYFTGVNSFNSFRPSRPKNADYGIKPWYKIHVGTGINFILRPRKTKEYHKEMEKL